jgi:hypothetical protein
MQACPRRWASQKWDSDVLPLRKITTFPAALTRFLLMRPVPQRGTGGARGGLHVRKKVFHRADFSKNFSEKFQIKNRPKNFPEKFSGFFLKTRHLNYPTATIQEKSGPASSYCPALIISGKMSEKFSVREKKRSKKVYEKY